MKYSESVVVEDATVVKLPDSSAADIETAESAIPSSTSLVNACMMASPTVFGLSDTGAIQVHPSDQSLPIITDH